MGNVVGGIVRDLVRIGRLSFFVKPFLSFNHFKYFIAELEG